MQDLLFNSNVIELRNKKHTHIEGHIHMMMGHGSSFTEQLFHFLFEASLMLLMGQNHIGTIPVEQQQCTFCLAQNAYLWVVVADCNGASEGLETMRPRLLFSRRNSGSSRT